MKDYPWLRYSESTNSLFCAYCVLFGPKEKGNISFSFSFSVTNWSNLSQLIKRHLLDKSKHHDYAGIGDDFMKIADSESPSTTSSLFTKKPQPRIDTFCLKKFKSLFSVVVRTYQCVVIKRTEAILLPF